MNTSPEKKQIKIKGKRKDHKKIAVRINNHFHNRVKSPEDINPCAIIYA